MVMYLRQKKVAADANKFLVLRYGEPIVIDSYETELFEGDLDAASKLVVKQIMTRVEKQLKDMTINAPDW